MTLSPRLEDALVFAARLHAGEVRKGTTIPYVSHVLGVASLALERGADEDEAIAALLHDAVEDAPGDPEVIRLEIRRRYGPAVLAIVDGCTDSRSKPKPPFRERKESYIAKLAEASPSTRLVSAADKLHNARAILSDYRAIGEALWARFTGGRAGTLWYYRPLADTFRRLGPGRLAEELNRVVSEIEHLASARLPAPRPKLWATWAKADSPTMTCEPVTCRVSPLPGRSHPGRLTGSAASLTHGYSLLGPHPWTGSRCKAGVPGSKWTGYPVYGYAGGS